MNTARLAEATPVTTGVVQDTPDRLPRQAWQQGLGALGYSIMITTVFPLLLEAVRPEDIQYTLERHAPRSDDPEAQSTATLEQAMDLCELAAPRTIAIRELVTRALGETVVQQIAEHGGFVDQSQKNTYLGHPNTVFREAMQTMVHFPLRLLAEAQSRLPEGYPPLYTSLQDIADILRTDWFASVVARAATPANGFWGPFSASREGEVEKSNRGVLDFTFRIEGDRTIFSFSPEAARMLSQSHTRANEQAREHASRQLVRKFLWLAHHIVVEASQAKSTAGCPVNRRTPHFTSEREAQQAARMFNISVDEARATASITPITACLRMLGDYLEHASQQQTAATSAE